MVRELLTPLAMGEFAQKKCVITPIYKFCDTRHIMYLNQCALWHSFCLNYEGGPNTNIQNEQIILRLIAFGKTYRDKIGFEKFIHALFCHAISGFCLAQVLSCILQILNPISVRRAKVKSHLCTTPNLNS